ncbi:MAG: DUF402 domain-containing protein [Chloroflexi bacterium]|nr:DUF402 domain-containing protein [Chloroflexota bacterium]
MNTVSVEKRKADGTLVIRYRCVIIEHQPEYTLCGGRFEIEVLKPYVHFRIGDRTVETFYPDRWYNILELHDVDDDRLKGWYCNIARPAQIAVEAGSLLIVYEDLALDVFVSPVGDLLVLDEDELAELQLPAGELERVWAALEQLREQLARRDNPFDHLEG